MKKSKFTTALCLLLIGLFVGSAVCIPVSAAVPESEWEHKDIQSDLDLSEMESYLKAGSYSAYLASHRNVPAGNRKVYVEDLSRFFPRHHGEKEQCALLRGRCRRRF